MWKPHLAPFQGETTGDDERFEDWYARVAAAMPGVPAELAHHWLYDNWGALPHNVDFLSLHQLEGQRAVLPLGDALAITVHPGWKLLETAPGYFDGFLRQGNWLAVQMRDRGTWPVPIVVLDNGGGLAAPTRTDVGRWHLLEGHRRLTMLHGLAARGLAKPPHEVWLVRHVASGTGEAPAPEASFRSAAPIHNVRLKFDEAVEALAVGAGSIQHRLVAVFRGLGLDRVEPQDLREHREVWSEMRAALRRVRDPDEGSVVASIRAMNDREACHRARTIVTLARWLAAQDSYGST